MSLRKGTDTVFSPEAAQLSRSCQFYGGAENYFGKWQIIYVGDGIFL